MHFSIFEVFRIGIGPSSSHTVGPMSAVARFLAELRAESRLGEVARVRVEVYGSLALTGIGHATDMAIILGLLGCTPERVDPALVAGEVARVRTTGRLALGGEHEIAFDAEADLCLDRQHFLPQHPNGLTLRAFAADGGMLRERTYFSIGGGAVLASEELGAANQAHVPEDIPYPFSSGADLLTQGATAGLSIAQMVWHNEIARRPEDGVRKQLLDIWSVMESCIARGLAAEGELPGGLHVRRRAAALYRRATSGNGQDGYRELDIVSAYAMAVNEENAAGGRVVTAPTNGSAGVIPAVLKGHLRNCVAAVHEQVTLDFLLTAAGIGMLYKENASISAAEMGCQGEIGVSSSMAAAGLAAVLGGTVAQVENAAEIAMEHHLGMTCDPIGGLVQVPCIERNTMGAIKAINAARLALSSDGKHLVSLDAVIETMRQTGHDLKSKYRETSLGGLAVNVVLC
jgi:L-serine dehydratase